MKNIIAIIAFVISLQATAQTDSLTTWARENRVDKLAKYALNINLDVQDSKGYTPLIIAAYNGNKETVEWLLAHNANPDVQDNSGNTALMGVCFRGYTDVAGILLKNKAI